MSSSICAEKKLGSIMTCSFRSVDHPDIVVNDVVLPESGTYKHPGFTLNSNLSWAMADVLRKEKYSFDK